MTKEYFLCSKSVIDHFNPSEVSKSFKSGYDFESTDEYFVGVLNFAEVDKYYNEVIVPYNEKSKVDDIDFWLRECAPGSMDVSKITIAGAKRNGLFVEIENKLNLTAVRNQAMTIYNLSQKYNCTPIEFINKIAKQ